jgi:hypothetical protein
MEKAKEWGISVKTIPGNLPYYGYFSSERKEIALASKEESVFFHELAHAAHKRLVGTNKTRNGKKRSWQNSQQRSCAKSLGKPQSTSETITDTLSTTQKKANLTPVQGCLKVISDVERVLRLILTKNRTIGPSPLLFLSSVPSIKDFT